MTQIGTKANLTSCSWSCLRLKEKGAVLILGCMLMAGCETSAPPSATQSESTSEGEQEEAQDAPYDYQAEEADVLLTYVTKDGRFLVAEKLSDIPKEARSQVRVVKATMVMGSTDVIFAGDLSGPGPTFSLKAVKRKQWEALGREARAARLNELQPNIEIPEGKLDVDAILYGASWCGACRAAEEHLKKRGARVIKKDIETEAGARKEMKVKLKSSGLSGSAIPVIDIGGIIIVGASPTTIDTALRRATAL